MGIKYSKRLEDIFLCLQCPAVNQTNVKSASRTPFNYSKSNHWLTEDMIMYNKACSLSWLGFERDVINYPETTGFNGKKTKGNIGGEGLAGHRAIGFRLIGSELGPHYISYLINVQKIHCIQSIVALLILLHPGTKPALWLVTGGWTKVESSAKYSPPSSSCAKTPYAHCLIQTV